MKCLRCNTEMKFLLQEKIQLGQAGFLFGDYPNLLAGALEVEMYVCPECRKLEFFTPDTKALDEQLPQKKCPKCGKIHDFDYPKCPYCKYNYYED